MGVIVASTADQESEQERRREEVQKLCKLKETSGCTGR